ncbi:hypothetical protein SDJN02_02223, partial [Cucurbita argyrosperma subsp. argyrosperma]
MVEDYAIGEAVQQPEVSEVKRLFDSVMLEFALVGMLRGLSAWKRSRAADLLLRLFLHMLPAGEEICSLERASVETRW